MTSDGEPPKKIKRTEGPIEAPEEEGPGEQFDTETQKALVDMDSCQNDIDLLNEKASEDILLVERKYNKLRKPYFEKRNDIIKKIPDFWVTVFVNHPQIHLEPDEEDCLHYMRKLEVEEFEDIKSGYKISFHFDENPFFENDILKKEFHLGLSGDPSSESTQIRWKEGNDLLKRFEERNVGNGGKKRAYQPQKSFFAWFTDHGDPCADEIAEVIKDDLWPNPLQYYLLSSEGLNEEEQEDEEDSGEQNDNEDEGEEEYIMEEEAGEDEPAEEVDEIDEEGEGEAEED